MEQRQLKSFKDLVVWQKSSDLAVLVYSITEEFPRSELYGLTNQMRRSVVSISSNLAEGFKRNHNKEKLQFYNIAYGSVAELESQIEIALKLNFLNKEAHQKLNALTVEVGKMLNGLIKSVNKSPKSFPKSHILNPIFFFAFLYSIFYILNPTPVHAATLYFSPSSGSQAVGAAFSVSVYVSSADQAINAASGIISFPSDKLEVASLSKTGSIFTLWVQEPSFSNSAGTINFEGIVLNPGFTGSAGKIISISFKTKASGSAALSFSSGSILANDGKGTNILGGLGGANFTIAELAGSPVVIQPPTNSETSPASSVGKLTKVPPAPIIYSSTHPDSNSWYSNNSPEFKWKLTPDITGASVYVTDKPQSNPGPVSDGIFDTKSYQNLEDGIWYLHLKTKNSFGWSPISHFKIKIDTTPPKSFAIKFIDGQETENPCPTALFDTTDSISGIAYYKVKVGEGNFNTVIADAVKSNSYTLQCQDPGKKTILVQAFDRAGNYTIATEDLVIKPIASPLFIDYPAQLRTDEILTVKGSAVPNADVAIWLQKEKDDARSYEVKSDTKGNFTFIAGEKLKEGVYKVWAQAIDSRGAKSNFSEKITIEAVPPYVLKIGRLFIDYLTVINTLIILIIGILVIITYLWYRISLWRKRIRKETRETKEAVRKAFNALKTQAENEVAKMDGNPRLNKREKEVCGNLKDALRVSEEFIEKEISDIEKELK